MTRRKRCDSAAVQTEAMQKAAAGIEPPPYVTIADDERPYWEAIVAMKLQWLPNDLVLAANLARINHDIELYSQQVRDGRRVDADGQKPDIAAAHKVLRDLTADALRLCRALQIHPIATQGDSRRQIERNQLNRTARDTVRILDNLIAKPAVQ